MTRPTPWTDSEIDSCIGLYLCMRVLAARGVPFVKAQLIREVRGIDALSTVEDNPEAPLFNRSRGSIEAKLMNVTACLHDIDRADLSMADHGYRPLANYQAALKTRVIELVKGQTLESLGATAERLASDELAARA